ncbi:hypothetical protein OB955_02755 [Halobacteria archaeon AArc-m2/3/4]|uniref:Uncharacterized protein n=2 Tax=Natronoglomus mannanivorans TaxID=2979990 RepID=A0AAP3E089_9EURY|nr:hypothetical protein [Halobacteria archaeon AArc-xg1-1]MCU4971658.1 hypothetical protein [Halobacteria archaeon AArc-m2/3/4]
MSSPPTTHDQRTSGQNVSSDKQISDQRTLERITPMLAKPIRVTSFWTAIVLPFLHVPLLATGLTGSAETLTFLGLLTLNLLALYVGHSHRA